jgi:hypothetical protein
MISSGITQRPRHSLSRRESSLDNLTSYRHTINT